MIRKGVRTPFKNGPPAPFHQGVSMEDATPDQLRFVDGELARFLASRAWVAVPNHSNGRSIDMPVETAYMYVVYLRLRVCGTKGGKKPVDTSWEKRLTLPWKLVEAVPLSYAKAIHDASGSREVFNEDGTMCNPPWGLIDDLVIKLHTSGAAATVIVPYWPDRSSHQRRSEMASDVIVYPPSPDLFAPSRLLIGMRACVGPPKWLVVAFRLPIRARCPAPAL
eukprot:jgi/Tetstr1/440936/TSEL_029205.t1